MVDIGKQIAYKLFVEKKTPEQIRREGVGEAPKTVVTRAPYKPRVVSSSVSETSLPPIVETGQLPKQPVEETKPVMPFTETPVGQKLFGTPTKLTTEEQMILEQTREAPQLYTSEGSRRWAIQQLITRGHLPRSYEGVAVGVKSTEAKQKFGYIPVDIDYSTLYGQYGTKIGETKEEYKQLKSLYDIGVSTVEEQKTLLETLKVSSPSGYWLFGEETTPVSRDVAIQRVETLFASNIGILGEQSAGLESSEKNIGILEYERGMISLYQEAGWEVDITETGLSFHEPSAKSVHESLYLGLSGSRFVAKQAMGLGIPALFNIGRWGEYEEEEYQRLLELSPSIGEDIGGYTSRFWTSPEAIESVYLPVATMGLGEVYTALKGGATGVITVGRIAGFGAKHPGVVKAVGGGLFGAGMFMVGGGIGQGVYIAQTNPEQLPTFAGKFVQNIVLGAAGFKLGEHFMLSKTGVPTGPSVKPPSSAIGQDVDVLTATKITPISEKTALVDIYGVPQGKSVISDITGRAMAIELGTGKQTYVFSTGKALIHLKPQQTGLLGLTKTYHTVVGDITTPSTVVYAPEGSLFFKSYPITKTSLSYTIGKGYGMVPGGQFSGRWSLVFKDISSRGLIRGTELIPVESRGLLFKGKYVTFKGGGEPVGGGVIREMGFVFTPKDVGYTAFEKLGAVRSFLDMPRISVMRGVSGFGGGSGSGIIEIGGGGGQGFLGRVSRLFSGVTGTQVAGVQVKLITPGFVSDTAAVASLIGIPQVQTMAQMTQQKTQFPVVGVQTTISGIQQYRGPRLLPPIMVGVVGETKMTTRFKPYQVISVLDVSQAQMQRQRQELIPVQILELASELQTKYLTRQVTEQVTKPTTTISIPVVPISIITPIPPLPLPLKETSGVFGGGWDDFMFRGKRYRKRMHPVSIPDILDIKLPGLPGGFVI